MVKYKEEEVCAVNISKVQELILAGWTIQSYHTYVDDDLFYMLENDNFHHDGDDRETVQAEMDDGLVIYRMRLKLEDD